MNWLKRWWRWREVSDFWAGAFIGWGVATGFYGIVLAVYRAFNLL